MPLDISKLSMEQVVYSAETTVEEKINYLKYKTIQVPSWSKLIKEYDPKKHPVMTDKDYVDTGKDKLSRITLGWQKLATKRMSALMFGIPVKRVYTTDNEDEKLASRIIEDIYKKNRIDNVNLERSKQLYASCECVTIWYSKTTEDGSTPPMYAGQESLLKLRCKNFSPMNGDVIYPLFDAEDDLIALSVQYTRTENNSRVTFFETFTDKYHFLWNASTNEQIEGKEITLGKIAGVYIHRSEPIWEDESNNVYEAEWTYSRNGNYIRKNSRPQLALYTDGKAKVDKTPANANQTAREIIKLNQGDKLEYVTWEGSTESVKFHIEELRHNFNAQLQLPDVSMDNMKSTPMSGESRKMLFMDAQMKVTCEAGAWIEFFDRELNVIRAYAKIAFPKLAKAFDSLRVQMIITPYQIRDEKENVETLATAVGTIASKQTCIKRLGWADDADEEARLIQSESTEDIFAPVQ